MTTFSPVALEGARAIRNLGNQARSAFIQREEAISVVEIALASGEHVIELGPPGTAKSAVVLFFAEGLNVGFFRKLLNPDTTRDELVGPINPVALQQGEWERKWAGLATSQLVFLDEVGKASGPVMNMTLDAMEERRVTGVTDRGIPLHCLFGATNETLSGDSEAMWDRFALRVVVRGFGDSSSLVSMLSRNRGKRSTPEVQELHPKAVGLLDTHLGALRRVTRWMAENPSDAVLETISSLFNGLSSVSQEYVSPRRWERVLRCAAGKALLEGRTHIIPSDLSVAKYMLWQRTEDIESIQKYVENIVDPDGALLEAAQKMSAELVRSASDALTDRSGAAVQTRARINMNADKILKIIDGKDGRPEWEQIRRAVRSVKSQMIDLL